MGIKKEIKYMNINDVKPYKDNPRHNTDEAIEKVKESISKFNFQNPIIVDENNEIIAGHTRRLAAIDLGMETVPVVVADDLSDEQVRAFRLADNIRAFRLADNKVAEFSEWDMDLLQSELNMLEDLNMDDFGFDMSEFTDETETEVEEDDFVEDVPDEPVSKTGDVYQLGNHIMVCGDSTNSESYKYINRNDSNIITFTSPPYNKGENHKINGSTKMKENSYNLYDDNSDKYYDLLIDFTKQNIEKADYTFVNIQQLANNKIDFIDYLHHFKNNIVDTIIWDKTYGQPAMARNILNSVFEYILIFKNEDKPKRTINTGDFRGTIDNIYRGKRQTQNEYSDIHAATFPIHLPSFIIQNFTKTDDIVIDCFGGTGTTLIACEQLNRKCYTIELDPKYVDVIINRWEQYTGEEAVLINGEG